MKLLLSSFSKCFCSILFLFSILIDQNLQAEPYPQHWWKQYAESERQGSWEILPHECEKGVELILSKKNELGIFSNFGEAPFVLHGVKYASVEGLWQMMKYPDPNDSTDPRNKFAHLYPYTRDQVKLMSGFEGKKAGDLANQINKQHGISNVSYFYQGKYHHFNYKDGKSGSAFHYQIISTAINAKVMQNPKLQTLLISTHPLILKPDHKIKKNSPPSYGYYDILMKIRLKLLTP